MNIRSYGCSREYHLIEADLVILDELGYLPFSQVGGALLLHLIGKRYQHTSLAITTNLSFAEWAAAASTFECRYVANAVGPELPILAWA